MLLAIPVAICTSGIVIAALACGLSFFLFGAFGRVSGLNRLAERYPATSRPEGQRLDKQTVQVGAVRYRRCVEVCISPAGLYLWVHPFASRYPPLMIPWGEFGRPQRTMIYWQSAVKMGVGAPPVTTVAFKQGLFAKFKPYLPAA